MEASRILDISLNALSDKKAMELKSVKVDELTVLTEYFVFATATSNTHVKALADEVDFKLSESGVEPNHIEGKGSGWILLDYGSVIIHIFTRQSREFYAIDNVWSDGETIDIDKYINSSKENK